MAELKWAKEYQKIYDRSQTPSGWNSLDKVRIEEIDGLMGEVDALKVRLEVAEDKLRCIADWCAAYPLEMFPKPNIKKARALLGDTLFTQLSAYSMRHVCEGIAKIAQAGGSDAVEESKTAQHPPA